MGIGLLPSVSLLHIPQFSPVLPGFPSLSSFHSQLHLQKCLWNFYFYSIFSSHLRLSLIQEGLKHSMRRGLQYHRGSRRYDHNHAGSDPIARYASQSLSASLVFGFTSPLTLACSSSRFETQDVVFDFLCLAFT